MTEQLDDLFMQIIQSEKRAQEKRKILETVKTDIENQKVKIKDTEEEWKSLQGQLALKVHQLSEGEMRLKLLQNRSKILKKQRDVEDREFNECVKRKKELKGKLDRNAENFSAFVEFYCNEYDLVASVNNQRSVTAQAQIEKLKNEEKELSEELSIFNSKQESIDKLKVYRVSVEKAIEQKMLLSKELDDRIKEELKENERLEGEKEMVCSVPYTSQEFQRLNKELESYNDVGKQLDGVCNTLQAELHDLKQFKWRNQLQQSRVLRQHNQRRMNNPNSEKESSKTSTNFKRISNYNSNSQENTEFRSDFIAASALLDEDDELSGNNYTTAPSGGKKPNLSKLTDAVRSKKSDQLYGDQPGWRFQRTGKFQYKKADNFPKTKPQ